MLQSKITKRIFLSISAVIVVFLILLFINFIPTNNLKTGSMSKFEGEWLDVYYEAEKNAAEEIRMIAPFLGLDWYIGDNIGTNIILTSPANPGKVHDYDNNKNAVLHEMVHTYNSIINPKMSYWIDNGLAGYLSDQKPIYPIYSYSQIPTIKQTHSSGIFTPISFANFNGYDCSFSYIKYLTNTYGWESVISFAKNEDYTAAFHRTEHEIYDEWIVFLAQNYSED